MLRKRYTWDFHDYMFSRTSKVVNDSCHDSCHDSCSIVATKSAKTIVHNQREKSTSDTYYFVAAYDNVGKKFYISTEFCIIFNLSIFDR